MIPQTSSDVSLLIKLGQILVGNNVDARRAVTVMIEAAHRKMERERANAAEGSRVVRVKVVHRDR